MAQNRIKELRNKKGLSQKEFAKAFSDFIKDDENVKPVSYATISRWEHGENEPKLQTWIKLADFFDVSVSYLQGFSTNQAKDFKSNNVKPTIANVVLEIQDILFYFFKHSNTTDAPNEILGYVPISQIERRMLQKIVQDYLLFIDPDARNFRVFIKNISAKLLDLFTSKGTLNDLATSEDVLKIINTFSVEAKALMRDATISNDTIMSAAIEGINTGKYIIHERLDDTLTLPVDPHAHSVHQFTEYKLERLPQQIDKSFYNQLIGIFNEAENKIDTLKKKYEKAGLLTKKNNKKD